MKKLNIFCFGFGQVAKNFINKLQLEKFSINLSATSRDKTQKKKINSIEYNNFYFNDEEFDPKLIEELKQSDHILISIPPKNGIDLGEHNRLLVEKIEELTLYMLEMQKEIEQLKEENAAIQEFLSK